MAGNSTVKQMFNSNINDPEYKPTTYYDEEKFAEGNSNLFYYGSTRQSRHEWRELYGVGGGGGKRTRGEAGLAPATTFIFYLKII